MSDARSREQLITTSSADADRDVVERLVRGELDALEELYDRYKALAYAVALRITRDAGLAEDAVQEGFLGAWRNAANFDDGRASVKTWLLSIVHHRAVDVVRRRRKTTELPAAEEAPDRLSVPDVWPEVAGRLDGAEVRTALSTLPDLQRETIELAYFDGLTQQEIALRMNAPLGTVKGRIRLGLLGLRKALVGDGLLPDTSGTTDQRWANR